MLGDVRALFSSENHSQKELLEDLAVKQGTTPAGVVS